MTIEKIARDELARALAQAMPYTDMMGRPIAWDGLMAFQRRSFFNGADAILPLLTDTASYRAGAEDMRERAAELLERNDMNSAGFMAAEVRSLPLPDPQPTPTQESRDVCEIVEPGRWGRPVEVTQYPHDEAFDAALALPLKEEG